MLQILATPVGSLQTNCYIAWDDSSDKCIVVDPGADSDCLLAQVRARGKQVEAILLTHGHFDHVGGVSAIREATGCKVYLHRADLDLPVHMTAGLLSATDYYDEGDALSLAGLNLQVLHTPGHTPGSVCLVCEDVIFSGDTLFAGTCGRTDFPGGSYSQMLQSLKRLAAMEGNFQVLPGHAEQTTLERERQYNPFMG